MSSGVAVVAGRRLFGGEESSVSFPPTRTGADDGAAATGLGTAGGPPAPGAGLVAAGLVAVAVRARFGGGGGGGVLGRAVLVMVGAVVLVAVVRADGVLDVVAAGLVAVFVVDAEPAAEVLDADVPTAVDPVADDAATDDPAADSAAAPVPAAFFAVPLAAKKSRQMGSTLCGSARNC
jgi:hypothetical protein